MSLNFPEVLIGKDREAVMSNSHSWEASYTASELKAHAELFDRTARIYNGLDEAGMDAWLNPNGHKIDSTYEPQYKIGWGNGEITMWPKGQKESQTIYPRQLITKINHRNFRIAFLTSVSFIDHSDSGHHYGRGISLLPDSLRGPKQIALSADSEAFEFVDEVIKGMEKEAIDLGVLSTSNQAEVSPVAA